MAIDEAITIIKAYRERLTDSVSTLLDGDIEAFDIAVEAMERESCGDCVSRQAVLKVVEREQNKGDALSEIEKLPPVNPQRTGHWKSFTHSAYHGIDDDREPIWREVKVYHCNLCNRRTVIKENYCPNCGARMEEEE